MLLGKGEEDKIDYLKNPTALLTKRPEAYKHDRQVLFTIIMKFFHYKLFFVFEKKVFSTVGTPDYIAPEVFG